MSDIVININVGEKRESLKKSLAKRSKKVREATPNRMEDNLDYRTKAMMKFFKTELEKNAINSRPSVEPYGGSV